MFEHATATVDARHRRFFADSGDARQVWALDSDTGRVAFLAAGGVDGDVRRACHEHRLRCPIADCPDPRLIAKGGTVRRHHFAHKVAHTKHDAATVFRAEAVAMLASWARHYRGAQVSTHDEDPLGVVTITSAFSGKRVELAITYDRRLRADEHLAVDDRQLIIGHTPSMLLPRREHPTVTDAWYCGQPHLASDIIHRRGAALAINPQLRLVATVMAADTARRVGLVPGGGGGRREDPTICFISKLAACRLEHVGIITPQLAALHAWQRDHPDYRPPIDPARRRGTRDGTRDHVSPPASSPDPPTQRQRSQPARGTRRSAAITATDINRIVLTATLKATPELRALPNGESICTIHVSCNDPDRDTPNRDSQPAAEIRVSARHPLRNAAGGQLTRGDQIAIDGHLETRAPQDSSNENSQILEILAEAVQIL